MTELRNPDGDDKTLQECHWFALCDRDASMVADHPILGPTPCCSRCAQQVGMDIPEEADVVGWRFIIHYKTKHGVTRFERAHFLNPDRDTCAANVRMSFDLWHRRQGDTITSIEWTSSIARGTTGWGQGAWLDTFKKEPTP